jgi:hypothetical protein
MDAIARFREYAAAFEDVVKSNELALLEPFFAADAVYEVIAGPPFGGRHSGRGAILAHLEASLAGFDRRFESRALEILEGPLLRDGAVWFRWRSSYTSPGLPELVFDGEERVRFEGERIVRLEDRIPPEMSAIVQHWLSRYGRRLPATR